MDTNYSGIFTIVLIVFIVFAWRKGWKGWALLPLVVCFGAALFLGAASAEAGLDEVVLIAIGLGLDILCIATLACMANCAPGLARQKQQPPVVAGPATPVPVVVTEDVREQRRAS